MGMNGQLHTPPTFIPGYTSQHSLDRSLGEHQRHSEHDMEGKILILLLKIKSWLPRSLLYHWTPTFDFTFNYTPLYELILSTSLQADKVHTTLSAIIATTQPILFYCGSARVLPWIEVPFSIEFFMDGSYNWVILNLNLVMKLTCIFFFSNINILYPQELFLDNLVQVSLCLKTPDVHLKRITVPNSNLLCT